MEVLAALKAIIAHTHDDVGAAALLGRLGGVELLWSLREAPNSEEVRWFVHNVLG